MNMNLMAACSGEVATTESLESVRATQIFRTLAEGAVLPETPKAPEGKSGRTRTGINNQYGRLPSGVSVCVFIKWAARQGHDNDSIRAALLNMGIVVSESSLKTASYNGRNVYNRNGEAIKASRLPEFTTHQIEAMEGCIMS